MKINTKTYMLLRRCVAAKQLEAYAGLCKTMSDFNELYDIENARIKKAYSWEQNLSTLDPSAPIDSTPKSKPLSQEELKQRNIINNLLDTYIPLASAGDLSFLESPQFQRILRELPSSDKATTASIISHSFQEYARNAKKLSDFRKAEAILLKCASKEKDTGVLIVSPEKIKAYHSFMQEQGGNLKVFDDYVSDHTKTSVGRHYLDVYRKAYSTVKKHSPEVLENDSFSQITPGTYNADIRDYYKPNLHKSNIEKLETFTAKDKSALKRTIALVLAANLGLASIAGGINYNQAKKLDNITISNAEQKGYSLEISDSTRQSLEEIRRNLEALQTSGEHPTVQQLDQIRDSFDSTMDDIFTDLVTPAFERAHPDYTVKEVETRYDLNAEHQKWIAIEYLDKDGNTQTKKVTNLDAKSFLTSFFQENFFDEYSTIGGSFDAEIDLDRYYNYLKAALQKDGISFEEKTEASTRILNFFEKVLEAEKKLAAKRIVYKDGIFELFPEISLAEPEKLEPSSSSHTSPTSITLNASIQTRKNQQNNRDGR